MGEARTTLLAFVRRCLRERSVLGTVEGFLSACATLPLLLAYLPVGFQLSLVNFTYGSRGLDPSFKAQLPKLFLLTLFSMYLVEIIFRGAILRSLMSRHSRLKAFWIHLVCVNFLLAPLFWQYGRDLTGVFLFRLLLLENFLESAWALFFFRTGSLLATGFLHGSYNFLRLIVINDVAGSFETLYYYSAAADDFYWLMLALTFLVLAVQILIGRLWGFREKGAPAS